MSKNKDQLRLSSSSRAHEHLDFRLRNVSALRKLRVVTRKLSSYIEENGIFKEIFWLDPYSAYSLCGQPVENSCIHDSCWRQPDSQCEQIVLFLSKFKLSFILIFFSWKMWKKSVETFWTFVRACLLCFIRWLLFSFILTGYGTILVCVILESPVSPSTTEPERWQEEYKLIRAENAMRTKQWILS